jgi:hypothetical protein
MQGGGGDRGGAGRRLQKRPDTYEKPQKFAHSKKQVIRYALFNKAVGGVIVAQKKVEDPQDCSA